MPNTKDSITNVTKQIQVKVQHLMKETVDKPRTLISAGEGSKNKSTEKMPLTLVGQFTQKAQRLMETLTGRQ